MSLKDVFGGQSTWNTHEIIEQLEQIYEGNSIEAERVFDQEMAKPYCIVYATDDSEQYIKGFDTFKEVAEWYNDVVLVENEPAELSYTSFFKDSFPIQVRKDVLYSIL